MNVKTRNSDMQQNLYYICIKSCTIYIYCESYQTYIFQIIVVTKFNNIILTFELSDVFLSLDRFCVHVYNILEVGIIHEVCSNIYIYIYIDR